MKQIHSYKADGPEPLVLIFDRDIPGQLHTFPERQQRKFWQDDAHMVVNYLCKHLPAGLIGHIFAELALRQASVHGWVHSPEPIIREEIL